MQKLFLTLTVFLICFASCTKNNPQATDSTTSGHWEELGGLNSLKANYSITKIICDKSNNLYAVGNFTNQYSNKYVAKYSKALNSWSELGGTNSLKANCEIDAIAVDDNENIYVAGCFKNSSGHLYVAKYDKSTNSWLELGGVNTFHTTSQVQNINNVIQSLMIDKSGNLYVGGMILNNSNKNNVYKWTKSSNSWSKLGNLDLPTTNYTHSILSIVSDNSNNIYIAGNQLENNNGLYIAKWDGAIWKNLGQNPNYLSFSDYPEVTGLINDQFYNIYAAGRFNFGNGMYVAKYDKTSDLWGELGGKTSLSKLVSNNVSKSLASISIDSKGNIYVGGFLATSDGLRTSTAKWDLTTNTWSLLAANNSTINIQLGGFVTLDYDGNVYCTGSLNSDYNYFVAKYVP